MTRRLARRPCARTALSDRSPSPPRRDSVGGASTRPATRRWPTFEVRAYNDFMLDEWYGTDPEVLVPTIICQLWDAQLAADEVRRCAERGARALTFPRTPTSWACRRCTTHSGIRCGRR